MDSEARLIQEREKQIKDAKERVNVSHGRDANAEYSRKNLDEIRADKTENPLFVEYLKQQSADELLRKHEAGNMDSMDSSELSRHIKEFNEIRADAKHSVEFFSDAELDKIIKFSPDLEGIVDMHGSVNLKSTIEKCMLGLAVKDPDRFKKIRLSISQLEEARKRTKGLDKEFEMFAKINGISESDAVTLAEMRRMGISDREIAGYFKQDWGRWKKWVTFRANAAIKDKLDDLPIGSFDKTLADIEKSMKVVGGVLAETFVENGEWQKTFSHRTRDEAFVADVNKFVREMQDIKTEAEVEAQRRKIRKISREIADLLEGNEKERSDAARMFKEWQIKNKARNDDYKRKDGSYDMERAKKDFINEKMDQYFEPQLPNGTKYKKKPFAKALENLTREFFKSMLG